MKAIYGYDPAKWRLGTLCIHGHAWPGTQQSLRRIHKTAPTCAACGNGGPYWLAGFIIGVEDGELPHGTKLSKPCKKHGHTYLDTGWCLRKGSKCVVCEPERIKLRHELERSDPELKARVRARCRAYEDRNREQINARRREQVAACPEQRQRRIDAKRADRAAAGARSLLELRQESAYHRAIKAAGQCPSVTQLVIDEQRRYWREHPEEYRIEVNRCKRHEWQLKYLTNPELRRYNREKSKRRKARMRGNHVVRVTAPQIRQRFAQFDHACAYCGCIGDLHQDHFLPISKGGTHVLSNIIPACQTCNFSKRDHDPETWYRAQSFFSVKRWRIILTVTGKRKGAIGQLALI